MQERSSAELLCASGEMGTSHKLTHGSRFTLLSHRVRDVLFSLDNVLLSEQRVLVYGDGRHLYLPLNLTDSSDD